MITRRAFGLCAGAGALALNSGIARAAPGPDPLAHVNPELRPMATQIQRMIGDKPLTQETLAAQRKQSFSAPPLAAPAWSERRIPGPPGAPEVRVYVINAGTTGSAPRAAILHIHGGGYVLGDAKSAVRPNQELATALNCVIVSVDYRLAPEVRFPGALEDNYAALKWLHRNAGELGVDRSRIAVMGESAGGGHAAMLAIAARDRGEIPLVYQALIYPMLDDRTGSSRRTPPFMGPVVWNEQRNRFGWTSLLGVPAGSRRVPYGSVPARVENLAGLPPAFIGVGSVDLFAEEDVEYARRLIHAGVPTELTVVPGAFHGFNMATNTRIVKQFNAALQGALADALKPKA